jgi:ADP-heptose:LPS heptosyltransferase/predicted SAM-dependent methyltransferase
MTWRITDPCGDESGKVKYEVVPYIRGKGIDVGCGPNKIFPYVVGVDSGIDTELFNIEMKPDVVCDDACDLSFIDDADLDFVFSSHLLEHIQDTAKALKEWWRVIKVGGYLVLYLPHCDLYPRIGTEGSNPDHKHDFSQNDITLHMMEMDGWELVVDELRSERTEYSFLQVYKKTASGRVTNLPVKHHKTACVVRYGGFGDMIQASNLFPELKRQGYHLTVMTTPKGKDILENDPHVDDWLIQDDNQVPNHELSEYWTAQARRFTKFVQLSESIEGTLLAMPGRANHMWPEQVRHVELNKNYLEWTNALAELPYHSEARFYPSIDETIKALAYLKDIRNARAQGLVIGAKTPRRFNILWALAGSSQHKFSPHMDTVIARIMLDMPEAEVIFNGDMACKILEAGWENEPRVHCESGEMSIRDSLALALNVDCVVGPETGVLNAVAFEDMPKVVMLSHSTVENLTKHWINTESLVPPEDNSVACGNRACHRLHFTREFCPEHESGASMCQAAITPAMIYEAIHKAYLKWKTHEAD